MSQEKIHEPVYLKHGWINWDLQGNLRSWAHLGGGMMWWWDSWRWDWKQPSMWPMALWVFSYPSADRLEARAGPQQVGRQNGHGEEKSSSLCLRRISALSHHTPKWGDLPRVLTCFTIAFQISCHFLSGPTWTWNYSALTKSTQRNPAHVFLSPIFP